jgi:hypothetical protein
MPPHGELSDHVQLVRFFDNPIKELRCEANVVTSVQGLRVRTQDGPRTRQEAGVTSVESGRRAILTPGF